MAAPPLTNNPKWLDKVQASLVGTAFAQTDPEVLELFRKRRVRVRVKENTSGNGVFHPKILVGLEGRTALAVVGSSNFTAGGLRDNDEAGVFIRGLRTDANIQALLTAIETWYDRDGRVIDGRLIRDYRAKHARLQRRRASATVLGSRSEPVTSKANQLDLDLDWRAYYELLRRTECLPLYTEEMRRCQAYFAQYGSLAEMREAPDDEPVLSYVAGFGGNAGAFCSTRPARDFKQLIKSDAHRLRQLSKQLDKIPAEGHVDLRKAQLVTRNVLDGFDGVGLGCWTRLLAVKRPDVFIAVNSASISAQRLRRSNPTSNCLVPYTSIVGIKPILHEKDGNSRSGDSEQPCSTRSSTRRDADERRR